MYSSAHMRIIKVMMRWTGFVAYMREKRTAYTVLVEILKERVG
jgi:hypothetical protein